MCITAAGVFVIDEANYVEVADRSSSFAEDTYKKSDPLFGTPELFSPVSLSAAAHPLSFLRDRHCNSLP